MPQCKLCGKEVNVLSGNLLGSTTCQNCELQLSAAQVYPKCPKCGTQNLKKRFLGGSKGGALAAFGLAVFFVFDHYSGKHPGPFAIGETTLILIFVLAGIGALTTKPYRCTKCKTAFNLNYSSLFLGFAGWGVFCLEYTPLSGDSSDSKQVWLLVAFALLVLALVTGGIALVRSQNKKLALAAIAVSLLPLAVVFILSIFSK